LTHLHTFGAHQDSPAVELALLDSDVHAAGAGADGWRLFATLEHIGGILPLKLT